MQITQEYINSGLKKVPGNVGGKAANVHAPVFLKAAATPQVKPPPLDPYSVLNKQPYRFITSAKCCTLFGVDGC